jgi:hypothetical protein
MHLGAGGHASFPPLVRVRVEQLACCEPAGLGLHLTHWSTRTLAEAAALAGIVPRITNSTVSLILRHATLQPHRYRYWKTPTLNDEFVELASPILWCYEQIERLTERGEVVVCWDEKPNLQALERPRQLMRPGQIERLEFEYTRHGTVNFGVALAVGDGSIGGWCLDKNDSEHLCPVLAELFEALRDARKIHLIWDEGASHGSGYTKDFLRQYRGWVRVLPTPPHAGWLNQAELLLHAFSARYLYRASWSSRQHLSDHLLASVVEYDELFAHPFTWSWTRRDMHRWIDEKSQD